MHEPLPLSKIHGAVLEFLQGRDDAVLFGAQAVNAYVSEPRATQDVDILSTRAAEFAEELREHLSERFHIAVRVREIKDKGFRVYQTRKEGNRHLVDIRKIDAMPETEIIERIQVLSPLELMVSKVVSFHARKGMPKAGTDWRDLAMLFLKYPELKENVEEILIARNVDDDTLATWNDVGNQNIEVGSEDDDLNF